MKRVLEEERQRQLDQYGGVDDNMKAIPFQKIFEYKMKKLQQANQDGMSATMTTENMYQPAISGSTLMSTNMTT